MIRNRNGIKRGDERARPGMLQSSFRPRTAREYQRKRSVGKQSSLASLEGRRDKEELR